ncbi:MAG: transcription-repair coupling factor [Gammaproteobacteria bacterium]|nr:transcription-repair coupling factor [Gammaproteobacteria bacterium]
MSDQIKFSSTPFAPPTPQQCGDKIHWAQLYGSARGLSIVSAAQQTSGPLLVLLRDTATLNRLEEEINFYASGTELPCFTFPDQETLPYDRLSPHPDITSRRLEVMTRLPTLKQGIVLATVSTVMQVVPPQSYIDLHAFNLTQGEELDRDGLRLRLEQSGYRVVSQVMEHGEYAFRGSIVDLFPMGAEAPYRIDLFDDEVESLRLFDPESQRTTEQVEAIHLLPAREFPMSEEGVRHFRQAWRSHFEGDPQQSAIYRDISQGLTPSGIDYYLPLFFEQCVTLFEYLPATHLILIEEGVEEACEQFWVEIKERHQDQVFDQSRPVLTPEQLFLKTDQLFGRIKQAPVVELEHFETEERSGHFNLGSRKPMQLGMQSRSEDPLQRLIQFIDEFEGRVVIAAESAGRREALLELFHPRTIYPKIYATWHAFLDGDAPLSIVVTPLEQGLLLSQSAETPTVTVITEPQIFGEQVLQRRRRNKKRGVTGDAVIHHLSELQVGAPVVHIDHGVGRYQGLVSLDVGGGPAEYLLLEYTKEDKLYVPVTSLHLIGRYTGTDPEKAPLHRLGSEQWQKARKKAAEKVRDVAAELLEIYAKRAAKQGYALPEPDIEYQQFSAQFPFEETPDQADAIDAVVDDLTAQQPMDRLICGDVGFGKTEVAMRAAFLTVQSGRQIAVLVPTTLLAQQHYENFRDRFADWPFKIEVLSRFKTAKETSAAMAQLESGAVDIVIGTHKLIQKSVKFKNLGMVVIDEEHRFGVRQKEQFKKLRAEVDVLTLTATPIPRTLNMSMSGLRDLSIIATPPSNRVAIKTFVREWDPALIREACLREIRRGGQVYFLHNKVETIDKTASELQELLPEATIEVAHGQMREHELERVMKAFYHRRFNILVCTTIIETGIDIPTANTIIMDRADRLGLAQLYQLRGRVGRSHHRAYAYLVIPPKNVITPDAVKRLEAIESLEELGAGFTLAVHDMEIRGAGELLGDDQSGRMQEIGFDLYAEMLERAVEDLKQGTTTDLEHVIETQVEVDLGAPALLPEDYLPDVNARLVLYKRIAGAKDLEALNELQVEMIDRFGLLPDATKNLIHTTAVKLMATPLGVQKIEANAEGAQLLIGGQHQLDPMKIITLIQSQPNRVKLNGQDRIRLIAEVEEVEERRTLVENTLQKLAQDSAPTTLL